MWLEANHLKSMTIFSLNGLTNKDK